MCPMAGAENHPRCRRNEQGQPLLVNGVAWQQYLMLLMMSTKLLTECDKVLKVGPNALCSQRLGCRKQTHLQGKGSAAPAGHVGCPERGQVFHRAVSQSTFPGIDVSFLDAMFPALPPRDQLHRTTPLRVLLHLWASAAPPPAPALWLLCTGAEAACPQHERLHRAHACHSTAGDGFSVP